MTLAVARPATAPTSRLWVDAPILTGPAYAVFRGQPLAIGILEQGEFRPGRVFNLG